MKRIQVINNYAYEHVFLRDKGMSSPLRAFLS